MARGFWTGLGHGGALSAGVLVLLALAWPLPRPGLEIGAQHGTGQEAAPDQAGARDMTAPTPPVTETPADADSAAVARDEPVAAVAPAATAPTPQEPVTPEPAATPLVTAAPDAATGPEAQAVGLPVGSEFGRGSDVAPRLPAPLSAPDSGLRQSDAPAVSAPAAEPSPVAITGTPERPDAARSQPDAPRPASVDDAPEFARPPVADLPGFAAAPGLAAGAERDAVPRTLPEPLPAARPTPDEQPETAAAPAADLATRAADMPAEATAPEATAPAEPAPVPVSAGSGTRDTGVVETTRAAPAAPVLRSPALDLSLPPDLSDLRRGSVASE